MQTYINTFQCRFYLIDNQVYEMKCWCYSLDPMTTDRRPDEEWALEHMQGYLPEDLYKMFSLAPGDWQILLTGVIRGSEDYFGEYDEDMEVEKFEIVSVPEEFAKYFTKGENNE